MIELSCALAPAEPRNSGLRRAGAKAVLVGPPAPPSLPFEVVDSKVRVPTPPAGTVSRTALVNRLRAAGAFPLVLVVAPAGYGKTTLLSQWAGRDVRPFAWVSVDEGDDDPVTLLQHVAAALDRVEPLPPSALEPLASESKPARARALHRLGAAIGARQSPFVLVLDGADRLTGDSIAAVATLVGHIPAGSMIVLSGRVLPELPVAALRARGPLLELGPYELALSRREAEMLLRAARLELEDAEINELVERTEGWAAGLYLTALAARAEGDELADALSVTGADRYLADYFRSEYLSHLTPERLTLPAPHVGAGDDVGPALRRRPRSERARRSSSPRWSRRTSSSSRSTATAARTATTTSSASCSDRSSRTASRSSFRCSTSERPTGSRRRATPSRRWPTRTRPATRRAPRAS